MVFLLRDSTFEEIYNGPGAPVWALLQAKPRPNNGQYQVSVAQLRRLFLKNSGTQSYDTFALVPANSEAMGAAMSRHQLGIFFVRGIGEQPEGDTLLAYGEPMLR